MIELVEKNYKELLDDVLKRRNQLSIQKLILILQAIEKQLLLEAIGDFSQPPISTCV